MIKGILSALGFGWSKWITVKENQWYNAEISNPITGYHHNTKVLVDVQRKENSLTEKIKYRHVKK